MDLWEAPERGAPPFKMPMSTKKAITTAAASENLFMSKGLRIVNPQTTVQSAGKHTVSITGETKVSEECECAVLLS